jgi:hypothetical protein
MWFKKAQLNRNNEDLSLVLCGILYPINKEYVNTDINTDSFEENNEDIIDYYYSKLFELTFKFSEDHGLNWDDAIIGEICASIINNSDDDFSSTLESIREIIGTTK